MEKLTLIKVGGKIVEEPDTLQSLLKTFAQIPGHKVLVHGGGRSATKVAAQLGLESVMVNGRRVTDAETLKVVTMGYGYCCGIAVFVCKCTGNDRCGYGYYQI